MYFKIATLPDELSEEELEITGPSKPDEALVLPVPH